jgi:hypothetical protein
LSRSEIRYAPSTGGADIAYEVLGDGPVDLVFVSGFITHLDFSWHKQCSAERVVQMGVTPGAARHSDADDPGI